MTKRIFIDTGLLSLICGDDSGKIYNNFLDITNSCGFQIENRKITLTSDWSLFLEFIGLGRIMEKLSPQFDKSIEDKLLLYFESDYQMTAEELNVIIESAYADCLIECGQLNELKHDKIENLYETKKTFNNNYASKLIIPTISDSYISSIRKYPKKSLEEISYNLAWELLAIRLFSLISSKSIKKHSERVLKLFEPLVSIWHKICLDFGTQPGLFRLFETSYLATVSKQSNMSKYDHQKLKTYKEKYRTRSKGDLTDCMYLEYGMIGHLVQSEKEITQYPVTVFTCDKLEQVTHRLSLFRYMLEKIVVEVDGWKIFPQYACNVYCLEFRNNNLHLVDSVSHAICL